MNFIAASLLYHSDEIIAFYLLERILNEYKYKDIYLNEMEGFHKHCRIIEYLLLEKIPLLYEHFQKNEIKAELFSTDWLIGLFTSSMPVSRIHCFFSLFFKHGWIVVYKFVISILETL